MLKVFVPPSITKPVVTSCLLLLAIGVRGASAEANDGSWADPAKWVVEQRPGGSVQLEGGTLEIKDVGGCTVWWRTKLTAPVEIRYTAVVLMEDGPFDRLSDLNCFWMASDPEHPEDLFHSGHGRTGAFADYDALQTYYVGYGGNYNSTTRFRRYAGGGPKPLLPEHDLREPPFLLEPNHAYEIRLVAKPDGVVQYYRDGELVFDYRDPEPLREGWFGIRTVKSHLRITNLEIRSAE